ncbi:hypothetical protein ASF72_13005 [Arthrobacter sp. Leaf141]|uniref:DUF3846 domain-containing protein n=2 Tax=Micrococcales TaxID=85006 RepID=UPI000700FF25|nr:hypothetical protein [Arthrobacter sp. Leaf141]KQR01146.1 hypothetical protein ASF72_13005 [Arthrobacter sp. Leaf141]
MKSMCNALIIPAQLTQPVRLESVDTDMPALQRLMSGNIEAISTRDWHAYVSDEGNRLPQNIRAEVLAREAGVHLEEVLNGTAVFLGHCSRGQEVDAPLRLIRLAEALFEQALAA